MIAKESDFYVIGGTLRHDAPCYVERQADRELFESLLRGDFCYLLTARQMGKSSLMVRTAQRLRERGINVLVLDLTAIGQNLTPEQWYDGLLTRLGRQARLEDELDDFWRRQERRGPCQRLFVALEEVVLPQLAERARQMVRETAGDVGAHAALVEQHASLVIFVDEIDTVRSLPFSADEFFAAMRECYNRRAESPEFRRLAFCLLGVATPSDLIQDTRLTPFNIGRRIELHDFSGAEAAPLAQGLGLEPKAASAVLQRILHWTSGHPYLTQRLCKEMAGATGKADAPAVDRLCATLFFSLRAREQDDNLLFVRDRLLRSGEDKASLLTLYAQVHRWRPGVRDEETNALVSVLRLSGVVRTDGEFLRVRNRIYLKAFDRKWVRANMPDAEVRRQRKAFQRGVLRTASIAAVVVAMMTALLIYADRQTQRARRASAVLAQRTLQALLAQARHGRLLGLAGQRFEGLKLLEEASHLKRSLEVRNEAIACLALPDLRPGLTWGGYPSGTVSVAFNEGLDRYARSDLQGNISVRRVENDQEVLRLPGFGDAAIELQFSPEGAHLAAIYPHDDASVLCLWDMQRGAPRFYATNAASDAVFDFSQDGRLAAFGGAKSSLQIMDIASGSNGVLTLSNPPMAIRFRPGSHELAYSSAGSLRVGFVDVDSHQERGTLHVAGIARVLAWSPDGSLLAVAGPDMIVRVWNRALSVSIELKGHRDYPTQLAFSHSGRLLASCGRDHTVRLWDAQRGGRPRVTLEDARDVRQLQFSPDDRRLAALVSAPLLQLWEVAPGLEHRSIWDPEALKMTSMDIHPGGRLAASGYEAGVTLWDLDFDTNLLRLPKGKTDAVAFSPATGELILSAIQGIWSVPIQFPAPTSRAPIQVGFGRLLDLPVSASRLFSPPAGGSLAIPSEDRVRLGFDRLWELPVAGSSVACASDGGSLAVLSDDRVRVWRMENKDLRVQATLQDGPGLRAVALGPGNRWVAAANWGRGEVSVWDLAGGNGVTRLPVRGPANLVSSRDGSRLAVGTETSCDIWGTEGWQRQRSIPRETPGTRPALAAFSPDGLVLAFTSGDAKVELVEASTGRALAQLESPRKETLIALRFASDGSRLSGATEENSIETWDLAALRTGLAALGLDWDLPAYPARPETAAPLQAVPATDEAVERASSKRFRDISEVRALTEQLEANPADLECLRRRAGLLYDLGDWEASAKDWRVYLKLEPTNTWALRDLAYLLTFGPPSLRDYPAAVELAGRAAALDPLNVDNQYRAGVASWRSGSYSNALAYLEKAARLVENKRVVMTPFILIHQAMCLAKLGRGGEAKRYYDLASMMVDEDPVLFRDYRPSFDLYKQEADQALGK